MSIEVNLACGDTIAVPTVPAIGAYRHCIYCDSRKRVTSIPVTAPILDVVPAEAPTADILADVPVKGRLVLYGMMKQAYDKTRKLEMWTLDHDTWDQALSDMAFELLLLRLEIPL